MQVKYSIVVPIYGVEKYLRTCIDSLIKQPFDNIEIILVDDGSKDSSPKICDEYKSQDKRIVVIHKSNGGLVSARQAGASIARGEYLACVDGDDWVSANYIERLELVTSKYSPDVICFCANKVDQSGSYIHSTSLREYGYFNKARIQKEIFPYLIEDRFGRYFSPSIWSKVYKRDVYLSAQMEINPRIKIGEDHVCTKTILSRANSIVLIDDKLYNYRLNNESMTKEKKPFDFCVPKLIGEHFERSIDLTNNDFQEQINRCVVHLLFNTCVSAFYEKACYRTIKNRIFENLSDDYYKRVINNCRYDMRYLKGQLVLFALKHKCDCLMKLYSLKHKKKI